MRSPSAFSALAMNSEPSSASRTAAVAKARTFFTSRMRVMVRKRASAASARSTASAPRPPRRGDGLAEAAQHLLVEQRRRRAHGALVDDEAHRVRTYVDDTNGLKLVPSVLLAEQPFQAGQNAAPFVSWRQSLLSRAEARREVLLERLPTSREARVGEKVLVRVEGFLSRCRTNSLRGAVRLYAPALLVILEVGDHDSGRATCS